MEIDNPRITDVRNPRFAIALCAFAIGCVASGLAGFGGLSGMCWLCAAPLTLVTIGVTSHDTTLVGNRWAHRLLVGGLLAALVGGAVAATRFYIATNHGATKSALVLGMGFVLVALFAWRAFVAPTARRVAQAGGLAVVVMPFAAIAELVVHVRQYGLHIFDEREPQFVTSSAAGAGVFVAIGAAFLLGTLACAAAHVWFAPGRESARARLAR